MARRASRASAARTSTRQRTPDRTPPGHSRRRPREPSAAPSRSDAHRRSSRRRGPDTCQTAATSRMPTSHGDPSGSTSSATSGASRTRADDDPDGDVADHERAGERCRRVQRLRSADGAHLWCARPAASSPPPSAPSATRPSAQRRQRSRSPRHGHRHRARAGPPSAHDTARGRRQASRHGVHPPLGVPGEGATGATPVRRRGRRAASGEPRQPTMIGDAAGAHVGLRLEVAVASRRRRAGVVGEWVLKLTSTRSSSQRPSSASRSRSAVMSKVAVRPPPSCVVVGPRGLLQAERRDRAGAQLRVVGRVGSLGHVDVDAVQRRGLRAGDALDAQVGALGARLRHGVPPATASARPGRGRGSAARRRRRLPAREAAGASVGLGGPRWPWRPPVVRSSVVARGAGRWCAVAPGPTAARRSRSRSRRSSVSSASPIFQVTRPLGGVRGR